MSWGDFTAFQGGVQDGLQEMLQRRIEAELRAEKRKQQQFDNERLTKSDARAQQQLDANLESNRLASERQARIDALNEQNTQSLMQDRAFKQADDVRESMAPGTELPTTDPTAQAMSRIGLLTTSKTAAPGMGNQFQGPMPTGETPESVANTKPERYILTPTTAQAKTQADMDYKRLQEDRQSARDDEMARHNRVMEAKPSGTGNMSPAVESNIINRLTKEWDNESKTTRELNRQVLMMDAGLDSARRGDLAQGSQAVLVTFQKILDPTSVVRESEYMRSASGQSLLNQIKGLEERLRVGGAGVPLDQLEKYAALAKEVVKRSNDSPRLKQVRTRLERTAAHYGIPADLIFDEGLLETAASSDAPTVPFIEEWVRDPKTGKLTKKVQ